MGSSTIGGDESAHLLSLPPILHLITMQSPFPLSYSSPLCYFRRSFAVRASSLPISSRFCFSDHMNGASKSSSHSAVPFHHEAPSSKDLSSRGKGSEQGMYFESAGHMKSHDYDYSSASDHKTRRGYTSNTTIIGWRNKRRRLDLGPEFLTNDVIESLPTKGDKEEISPPNQFRRKCLPKEKKSNSAKSFLSYAATEGLPKLKPFDICLPQCRNSNNANFLFRESYDEKPNIIESGSQVLQPGMVLLKHYITHKCQVKIVNTCRELGLGPGGFYRPGYNGGGKFHLHMMCLGLDWDPNTRKYVNQRSIDGCRPHDIPSDFKKLVKKAILDAHTLIRADSEGCNAEDVLPSMSPNICIANFYTETGRLGLHQDRDESPESLAKGLPVVSVSVGDSAEFRYGDERDLNKAKRIVLESGDVLIFGGKSRHIYHGITCIIPNSTPSPLLQRTLMRPGRLNLTFRHF